VPNNTYYFLAYYRLTKLNIRFIRYLLAFTGVFLIPLSTSPTPSILWHQKIGDLFQKNLTKIVGFTIEKPFLPIFRRKNDNKNFEQKITHPLSTQNKERNPPKRFPKNHGK
jgi:hypothetical protein